MSAPKTLARTLHDIGLAAWFGGSLMGAVGLNGASQEVGDPRERARVADAGWGRWTPVGATAIGAHLIGSLQLTRDNASRLAAQRGVGTAAAAKAALTLGALVTTVYARMLGQKVMDAEAAEAARDSAASEGLEVEGATSPAPDTPGDVADAQRRLHRLQWAVPALTGAALVVNAKMGEQQRVTQQLRGLMSRVNPRK